MLKMVSQSELNNSICRFSGAFSVSAFKGKADKAIPGPVISKS